MRKIFTIKILVFLINTIQAFPVDFKLEKIKLQEDVIIYSPLTICLTEDDFLIIFDDKAGNIKMYNTGSGKLEKVIGRRGYGPNEFARPLFGFYSDRKLFVADYDINKILLYERTSRLDFVFKRGFYSPDVGTAHYFKDNCLYIAGSIEGNDGIDYNLFAMNLEKEKDLNYILPSYVYYDLKSHNKYLKEIHSKPDLSAISGVSYMDAKGDFAYLLWSGNLKIFKINLKTKQTSTFGQKTANYIKPYASNKLIHAFADRQAGAKTRAMERKKLSYVIQLFTSQNHVLEIYEARGKDSENLGYMLQIYTLDGTFLKEVLLPKILSSSMCFDKKTNTLYSHITEPTPKGDDECNFLVKCQIPINEIIK